VNGDRIGTELEDVRIGLYTERREGLRGHAEGQAAPLRIFEVVRQPGVDRDRKDF
jgi:hypothetical protein